MSAGARGAEEGDWQRCRLSRLEDCCCHHYLRRSATLPRLTFYRFRLAPAPAFPAFDSLQRPPPGRLIPKLLLSSSIPQRLFRLSNNRAESPDRNRETVPSQTTVTASEKGLPSFENIFGQQHIALNRFPGPHPGSSHEGLPESQEQLRAESSPNDNPGAHRSHVFVRIPKTAP